ncbi:ZIP family metal transporter [Candidatus Woesearchaeota archaeon]|nr:ZIP family metal transporter [Candidatus Woesearchaeota archaeon]
MNILLIIALIIMGPIIGSLIGVIKKPTPKLLASYLGFAAGVMISISFLQLIPEALKLSSMIYVIIGFVAGFFIMMFFDDLIPHLHPGLCSKEKPSIKRTAFTLLIGIALHNLPEGLAISSGFASLEKLGFVIALSIALHNIPEGIVTAAPLYASTKKRLKSFLLSSSTAIPILFAFLIGTFLFRFIPDILLGIVMAFTAGVMFYISGDELLPCAERQKHTHSANMGMALGVIIVLLTTLI